MFSYLHNLCVERSHAAVLYPHSGIRRQRLRTIYRKFATFMFPSHCNAHWHEEKGQRSGIIFATHYGPWNEAGPNSPTPDGWRMVGKIRGHLVSIAISPQRCDHTR